MSGTSVRKDLWNDLYLARFQTETDGDALATFQRVRAHLLAPISVRAGCSVSEFDVPDTKIERITKQTRQTTIVDVSSKLMMGCRLVEPTSDPGVELIREDVTLYAQSGKVYVSLMVQAQYAPSKEEGGVAVSEIPRTMKMILDKVAIADIREVVSTPWILQNDQDARAFHELINHEERHLPVLIVVQDRNGESYLWDPVQVAAKLRGFYHVVYLPRSSISSYDRFRHCDCVLSPGDVKVFHGPRTARKGNSHFIQRVDHLLQDNGVLQRRDPAQVAEILVDLCCLSKVRYPTKYLKPFAHVERALTLLERDKAPDLRSKISLLERSNDELTAQLQQAHNEVDFWCAQYDATDKDLKDLRGELAELRAERFRLANLLWDTKPEVALMQISIPDTYERMPLWCQHHLAGKLVLHPRAERSLASAQYKDVELVYRALLLLGNEYRDMCLSSPERYKELRRRFTDKLSNLHLGMISSDSGAQRFADYDLEYPVGSGNTYLMDNHLKRGNSFDPTYTLRLYFIWHEPEQVVVVGSLPAHLQNTLT
jgi:hypothetical protein